MIGEEITNGCIVPALQALAGGLIVGIIVAGISMISQAEFTMALGWVFISGGFTAGISWFSLLSDWRSIVLSQSRQVSTVTHSVQADERRQIERVRVEVISQEGRQGDYLDLPFNADLMTDVSRMLLRRGASFSLSTLAGAGKPLSRSEFEALRDLFIARGLAQWVNDRSHGRGVELTPPGRAVIRRFADLPTPSEVVDA